MAAALFFGDWDAIEAERHLQRAIELNPGYSTARLVYSTVLAASGRFDEAIEQDRRAIELDPFSLIIHWNASGTLFLARRYDEALAQARHALAVAPSSMVRGSMLRIYEQQGNYEAALDLLEEFLPEKDGGKVQAARVRQAYLARGPAGYWQAALDRVAGRARSIPAQESVSLAFLYTHLGEHARAIEYLEKAYKEHAGDMLYIRVEPSFDPLRSDPRFQALILRMSPRLLPAQGS
jgi:tetratricopeptide (TPR) repeat protein